MLRVFVAFVISMAGVLALTEPAPAGVFRDEARGFEVSIAPHWKPLGETVKRRMLADMTTHTAGGPTPQLLGAWSKSTTPQPTLPLFAVFFLPLDLRGMTYEQVDRQFMRGIKDGVVQSSRQQGMDLSSFSPQFDRAKNRFIGNMDVASDGAKLSVRVVGYLLADGLLMFGMYSEPATAVKNQSSLELLLMSMKIEPHAAFVASATPSGAFAPQRSSSGIRPEHRVTEVMARVFVGCLVLAGILVLVKKIKGKTA